MKQLIAVRSYRLRPGTAAAFHAVMRDAAVPMLRQGGIDVVAFGLGDDHAYTLVRAYADAADRDTRQAAFYASVAWREGPRRALVVHIDHYLDSLLWLSPEALEDLRRCNA